MNDINNLVASGNLFEIYNHLQSNNFIWIAKSLLPFFHKEIKGIHCDYIHNTLSVVATEYNKSYFRFDIEVNRKEIYSLLLDLQEEFSKDKSYLKNNLDVFVETIHTNDGQFRNSLSINFQNCEKTKSYQKFQAKNSYPFSIFSLGYFPFINEELKAALAVVFKVNKLRGKIVEIIPGPSSGHRVKILFDHPNYKKLQDINVDLY